MLTNPIPERIFVEPGAELAPLTARVLAALPQVPVVRGQDLAALPEQLLAAREDRFGAGKRQLALARFKGGFLKKCPGISPGMVCCNYYVVNLIKNCVYDCAYCFLQDFLENNPVLTAYVNVEDLLCELDDVFRGHPDRTFRVGTGELTDSLALEALLPYSDYLIPFFRDRSNAVLELKTKSDQVDNLLDQDHGGNVIVSWSLNPEAVAALEEKGAPGPLERLEAARRCRERGYRIGFHFDPVILFPGWEAAYRELIDLMFQHVPAADIEWVSLGSFRYRPHLKKIARERHPETHLFTQEHVSCTDGKFRYLRPERNQAYARLRDLLKRGSEDLNVYLCMETREIWEGVTGKMPRSDRNLNTFFDL